MVWGLHSLREVFLKNVFIWKESNQQWVRENLIFAGSFHIQPLQELGLAHTRSQGLRLGFSLNVWDRGLENHHCWFPSCALAGSRSKVEVELKPRHWDTSVPSGNSACCTTILTPQSSFSVLCLFFWTCGLPGKESSIPFSLPSSHGRRCTTPFFWSVCAEWMH